MIKNLYTPFDMFVFHSGYRYQSCFGLLQIEKTKIQSSHVCVSRCGLGESLKNFRRLPPLKQNTK